jgi:hypothetical protein
MKSMPAFSSSLSRHMDATAPQHARELHADRHVAGVGRELDDGAARHGRSRGRRERGATIHVENVRAERGGSFRGRIEARERA